MSSRLQAKSGKSASSSGSESTPDLRILENKDVALRKRKYECDCSDILADFRKEMLSFLQDFTKTQEERSETLYKDINEIKREIKDNSMVLQAVVAEQKLLKTEIDNMKTLSNSIQQKILLVEDDLSKLKNNSINTTLSQNPLSFDETILEVQDRFRREKNVVIIGIPEPENFSRVSRREYDKMEAMKLITSIFPECPDPRVVLRLGKYNQRKSRPIKACFDNQETVNLILKNKTKDPTITPRIYADQTPYQQQHIKNLRSELESRQQKGETDLTIKYLKGIPRIVQSNSKNEARQKPTPMT